VAVAKILFSILLGEKQIHFTMYQKLIILIILPAHVHMSFNPTHYDKSITLFAPDGTLKQVDYAEKAASKGQSLICCLTKDNKIILCCPSQTSQLLLDRRAVDKVSQVDENLYIAFAGLAGDGRALTLEARSLCRDYRMRFGSSPPVSYLANKIGKIQHTATLKGGERPYGIQVLIFGYDLNRYDSLSLSPSLSPSQCHIYMTHPSGEVTKWRAIVIGNKADMLNKKLERMFVDSSEIQKTIISLWEVLGAHDIETNEEMCGYDVYVLSKETDSDVVNMNKGFNLIDTGTLALYFDK